MISVHAEASSLNGIHSAPCRRMDDEDLRFETLYMRIRFTSGTSACLQEYPSCTHCSSTVHKSREKRKTEIGLNVTAQHTSHRDLAGNGAGMVACRSGVQPSCAIIATAGLTTVFRHPHQVSCFNCRQAYDLRKSG